MGWLSQNSEVQNCPRENSRMTRSRFSVLPIAWKRVRCVNVNVTIQNAGIYTSYVFVPRLIEILIRA